MWLSATDYAASATAREPIVLFTFSGDSYPVHNWFAGSIAAAAAEQYPDYFGAADDNSACGDSFRLLVSVTDVAGVADSAGASAEDDGGTMLELSPRICRRMLRGELALEALVVWDEVP